MTKFDELLKTAEVVTTKAKEIETINNPVVYAALKEFCKIHNLQALKIAEISYNYTQDSTTFFYHTSDERIRACSTSNYDYASWEDLLNSDNKRYLKPFLYLHIVDAMQQQNKRVEAANNEALQAIEKLQNN